MLRNSRVNDPKVCLIMLPLWDISQPPIGIAYLTSFLRSKGFLVAQRDLSVELLHSLPEDKQYIMKSDYHLNWIHNFFELIYLEIKDTIDGWIDELVQSEFQILGFSLFTVNKAITLYVAKIIKERRPDKIIIIGGPEASRYEDGLELIKNEFIDYIVTDEGEETFYKLITAIKNKDDIKKIQGVLFKEGKNIIDTGKRPSIPCLDELPIPSVSDFPLDYYKDLAIPILSSRGCLYRCSFCTEHVFWEDFRYRSGENVYKEFRYQFAKTGCKNFYIVDSLINGKPKELENLCDAIIRDKGLDICWGGKASIRSEMTGALLKKLYNAGNRSLVYGVESGSEKVLRDMRKPFNLELAKRVIKETHEAGIAVGIFWIIGFPTESDDDFKASISFLNEVKECIDVVTPGYGCGIFKGSALFAEHEKYGITFKEDGWYSPFNTPSIRSERIKRFQKECLRLGIKMAY